MKSLEDILKIIEGLGSNSSLDKVAGVLGQSAEQLKGQLDLWLDELWEQRKATKRGVVGAKPVRPHLTPVEAEHEDDRPYSIPVYGGVEDEEKRANAAEKLKILARLGNYVTFGMLLRMYGARGMPLGKEGSEKPIYTFTNKLIYFSDGFLEAEGKWPLDVVQRIIETDIGCSLMYQSFESHQMEQLLNSGSIGLKNGDNAFMTPSLRRVRYQSNLMLGQPVGEDVYAALYDIGGLKTGSCNGHRVRVTFLEEPNKILKGVLVLKTSTD